MLIRPGTRRGAGFRRDPAPGTGRHRRLRPRRLVLLDRDGDGSSARWTGTGDRDKPAPLSAGPAFVNSNSDGIDGGVAKADSAAQTGKDTNAGKGRSKRQISAAVTAARAAGKDVRAGGLFER